jgi:PEP-CTERM motif
MRNSNLVAVALALAFGGSIATADANPVTWTTWSPTFTLGTPGGAASGTLGANTVTYSGELQSLSFTTPPSYAPAGSFSNPGAGTNHVDNAPLTAQGTLGLFGGGTVPVVDTIHFSSAVLNPVIAIWSLGNPTLSTSFNFTQTPTFVVGGPSSEFGGSAVTVAGNTVTGLEGNGVIEFLGTFSSISWTNPTFENYYGFTVGAPAVPEPATWMMMILGFVGVGFVSYRRSRRSVAFAAA